MEEGAMRPLAAAEHFEDHEALAEALIEAVYEERRCIRALSLDEVTTWSQRRAALARQAIALGAPVPEDAAFDYRHVHDMARDNLTLLQDAHQLVCAALGQITERAPQTYSPQGQPQPPRAPRGVLVWRG
jgi:hypothetical protein